MGQLRPLQPVDRRHCEDRGQTDHLPFTPNFVKKSWSFAKFMNLRFVLATRDNSPLHDGGLVVPKQQPFKHLALRRRPCLWECKIHA